MAFQLVRFLVRFVMALIAKVEVFGMEKVPAGSFILAANHLGRLDSAVLLVALDRQDIIMPIAEKYKNHPIYGPLGRGVNAIWLNRFDVDLQAMRQILARMEKGGLMVIAPEGTRSKTEALQPGKPGVAFLAAKSGYPVVPVALTGTQDRLVLDNLKHLRRSKITATVGDPIYVEAPRGKGREEALQAATDHIMRQIAAMLPEEYRGVYA
ncbi:MAG: lysophospholipid acyltransferase family protein [Anaerolineales bacterium]